VAKFIFIRHGEADYSHCSERGFIGHGFDLAQLSKKGIEQIKNTAKDNRLKAADILISSPYTRALQSATIISKELDMDIQVEVDVHEWLPDKSFQFKTYEEVCALNDDFLLHKGVYPHGDVKLWESVDGVERRVKRVLDKYKHFEKVIIVCHGCLMTIVTGKPLFADNPNSIENGEIVEFIYE